MPRLDSKFIPFFLASVGIICSRLQIGRKRKKEKEGKSVERKKEEQEDCTVGVAAGQQLPEVQ